jgi:hypothetical protein
MKDYLIIDRSKWRTGSHGKGITQLLNKEGYMCCLGFRCYQMGIPKKDLLGKKAPCSLSKNWEIPDLVDISLGCNTDLSQDAILINDKHTLINDKQSTNKDREKQLTKLFSDYGITVEFTGSYGKK